MREGKKRMCSFLIGSNKSGEDIGATRKHCYWIKHASHTDVSSGLHLRSYWMWHEWWVKRKPTRESISHTLSFNSTRFVVSCSSHAFCVSSIFFLIHTIHDESFQIWRFGLIGSLAAVYCQQTLEVKTFLEHNKWIKHFFGEVVKIFYVKTFY